MPYTHNLYFKTIRYLEDSTYINLVNSKDAGFLKQQILSRVVFLILTPASLIVCAIDTILGLGAVLAAIFVSKHRQLLMDVAFTHFISTSAVFSFTYIHLLHVINPNISFEDESPKRRQELLQKNPHHKFPIISSKGNGFIADRTIDYLTKKVVAYRNSKSLMEQCVATRTTLVELLIASFIARVIDGVIGIFAASFSILSAGQFRSLNNLAYRTTVVGSIVSDFIYCGTKIINPYFIYQYRLT
jgi:type III secretion system FlhB-like substrate exporter